MEEISAGKLLGRFDFLTERPSLDWPAVNCPPERLLEFLGILKEEEHFDMLMDVAGVDWLDAPIRFSVVYHVYSTSGHSYVRIAVDCPDNENPEVPSVTEIWPGANWHERETFDMFGIRFAGHPDLTRILMWEGYPYYPLRKDFPLAGIETDLPAPDVAEETQARVKAAPMMGGPFRSTPEGPMSKSEPRGEDESWTEQSEKPV
jgi:NADH-quinone oxidoreductase subunit C